MATTDGMEKVTGYRCTECEEIFADKPVGPLYECVSENCGTVFSAAQGLTETGRKSGCPECNSTGRKQAELGCDECGEGEVEAVECIECEDCEVLVPVEEWDEHVAEEHTEESE